MPEALRWAWPRVRPQLDIALLGVALVAVFFLPKGFQPGFVAEGLVSGAGVALQAIGMVLILRSTRIINFAQAQLGLIAGVVFWELVRHSELVVITKAVCGLCLPRLPSDPAFLQSHSVQLYAALIQHDRAWLWANFIIAVLVALIVAPFISWVAYRLVIRRFEESSRLIATVVTIALGSILAGISTIVPTLVFQDVANQPNQVFFPYEDISFRIAPATLHIGEIATLVIAVVVALALAAFFLFHRIGIAMRGASDNPKRALTLGISVTRLSSISWMLAGTLSAIGAVLLIMTKGSSAIGDTLRASFQVSPLVQLLAAAVFARLTNLPLAVAASLALGVIQQLMLFNFGDVVQYQVLLVVLIGGALLLQASRQSRAEQEAAAGQLVTQEARPIPPELRHHPAVEGWVRVAAVMATLLVLGMPFAMSPAQVSLATAIVIFTIIGLSLLVLTGWAGQVSLGQFAFAAVGGYVTTMLAAKLGLFILLSLLGGALAGALVAVIIGVPALRLRGLYLAIMTLGFTLVTSSVLLNPNVLGKYLPSLLERPVFLGFALEDEKVFFYLALVFLALAFAAVAGLRRSRTARALIACRDNEAAAQSFGINMFRARIEAFAISGFLASLAGGLLAYHERGVSALAFAPEQSLTMFLIVVIGGLGSVIGPLLGAVYDGAFRLTGVPVLELLGTGIGVLGVLLLFPGGLSSVVFGIRDAWLRRIAVRYRIAVPSLLGPGAELLDAEAPIAPKLRAGGGTLFVPTRYELEPGWIRPRKKATTDG